MKNWWKILAVVLLLYTFLAGLLVPLKPGIRAVSPMKAAAGEVLRMQVTGYNTYYQKNAESVRAWLKFDDDHLLQANKVEIIDDRQLVANFQIPAQLPFDSQAKEATLILDNSIDGATILPTAVQVTQTKPVDIAAASAAWPKTEINKLHSHEGMTYPYRNIIVETIRNQYFHVPLWFGMILILLGSVYASIRYLLSGTMSYDHKAMALTQVGLLYGILGLVTGAIWAKFAWGEFWSFDPKQNMAAICVLIYSAYFVLRMSFDDFEKRARISAVFNIFAFAAMIPLLFVIPRMVGSLHPGAGGNPGFGRDDLDNTMRMVFYPAVIGWTLLGVWVAQLTYRYEALKERWYAKSDYVKR